MSNDKKMGTILHRELERKVGKVKHMKLEVMRPKTKNKFPAWINHNWSVHVNCYFFVKNKDWGKGEGEGGGGLIEKGGSLTFLLWKVGAY